MLSDDPKEHVDLSENHPDIVEKLKNRRDDYHKQIVPANFPGISKSIISRKLWSILDTGMVLTIGILVKLVS